MSAPVGIADVSTLAIGSPITEVSIADGASVVFSGELAFGIISMPDVSAFIGSAAIVGALGVIDGMSAPVGLGVTVLVSDA